MTKSDSKRPYKKPTLSRLGGVSVLTQGGAPSATSDSGNNSMS